MIKLNFIEQEQACGGEVKTRDGIFAGKRWIFTYSIPCLACLAVICAASLFFFKSALISGAQKRLEQVDAELQKISEAHKGAQQSQQQITALKTQKKNLEALSEGRIEWGTVIRGVAQSIPRSLTLKSFSCNYLKVQYFEEIREVKKVGNEKKVFIRKKPLEKLFKTIELAGYISKDAAGDDISGFVNSMLGKLKEYISTITLKAVTTNQNGDKEFIIEMVFHENFS